MVVREKNLIYIYGNGFKVGKKGRRIEVSQNGKKIFSFPLFLVDGLVVEGNNFITLPAMREILKDKKTCFFLTSHGKIWGVLSHPFSQNVVLRRCQYKAHFSGGKSLYLAKLFVRGKISNSRAFLMRLKREGKISDTEKIELLNSIYDEVLKVSSKDELLGIEGRASKIYFSVLREVLGGFGFEARKRRPPGDPANALLSFAYTLLQTRIFSYAVVVGFDPYIGFLHSHKWGRPSLVLDIMEEFRFFAERVVVGALNMKVITEESFKEENGRILLKEQEKRKFVEFWETKLREEITHPFFGYKVSWMRVFELQLRILAKYLMGEIQSYIPFKWK